MGLKQKLQAKKKEAETLTASSFSQEEELDTVRAWIDYCVYPKGFINPEDMLWCVLQVKNPLTNEKFSAVGETNHHSVGDYLEFHGKWIVKNDKRQFEFKYALRVDDDYVGATSMMAFLFGPLTAKKIIDSAYKGNSLEAIDNFKNMPEVFEDDVLTIKGVGPKKIAKAYEKHKKYIAVDTLYFKFNKFGLSLNKAVKLIKLWGTQASEILDKNIYNLINVDGFGFDTIDRIGLGYYHFDEQDGRRIEAYLIQLLKNAANQAGDCYMFLEGEKGLIAEAQLKLNVPDMLIRERIVELLDSRKLRKSLNGSKIVIYLPYIYKAEQNVAQMVSSAIHRNHIVREGRVDTLIDEYEKGKGFKFADKQKEGIKTSSINQFSIISGPPGSGKTTLIDAICHIFNSHKRGCSIRLVAPSGKAAVRMSESTGLEASTIHRLLGYNPDTGWKYNENNPLPGVDLIIVDEFSMVDILLFERLMKAISIDTIVILSGDKDQLPSVDCGQVLEDLIDVPYIPKTILEEIYRQSDGSTTLPRALDFNKNEVVPDLTEAHDFKMIEIDSCHGITQIKSELLNIYMEKVKTYGVENVCILEAQNVGELGTAIINQEIQNIVNPDNPKKKSVRAGYKKIFREGDRVIHQHKNMADSNVFNGMVGTIIECIPSPTRNQSEDKIVVNYDDTEFVYAREEFDNIALAYSLTIHKSQGSEYDCVIVLLDEHHSFMTRKKLVYTAMTRNKKELYIVGQRRMFAHAIKNKDKRRKTMLTHTLTQYEVI